MRVEVDRRRAPAIAGSAVTFAITVTNTTELIGGYTARVLGLDPTWVQAEPDRLSLFPGATDTITITVTTPPGLRAGDRRFAVQVRELTPPTRTTVVDLDLEIAAAPMVQMDMDPRTVTAGKRGSFGLLVDNVGNTQLSGALSGHDDQEKIRYRFTPPILDLAPGEHAAVEVRVKARRRFIGQPVVRPFTLRIDDGREPDQQPKTTATFMQRPLIARGAVSLLGLLASITVFALVITYALSSVVGRSAADRDLALQVAQAQQNAGGGGTGSISGKAVLLTTGAAASGYTVDVFAANDPSTSLGSAATDKTGSYHLGSLGNGDYKLRFRGPDITDLWYPAALTPADASPVTLQTGQDLTGIDARLGGLPATISGKIVADTLQGASITLQVPGTPVGATGTPKTALSIASGAVLQTAPVGADGSFALANVPSPSVYDLVVTEPGFATETQRIDVAGGENRKGVTITLRKGDGLISGHVTSPRGPVKGATITATYNSTTVQTISLSDGDPGAFTLRSLPTPASFSVVVTADGLAAQTVTLSLAPGQQLTGVGITLGGASGALSGQVVTAANGLAAPGVTVTVTNGVLSVQTVTETDGEPGAWQVRGLPVPSTYTVTFSRGDLASQSLSVALDAFGTATTQAAPGTSVTSSGIKVSMVTATAELYGFTVTSDNDTNTGVGETLISLSNGAQQLAMTSSSVAVSPGPNLPAHAGAYHFDNVPPGTYTVTVSRHGTRPTSQIVQLVAGDVTYKNLTVALPITICGTVENSSHSNAVVPHVPIVLSRASSYPTNPVATTQTDGNGRFCFSDVDAPENYILQADYPTPGAAYSTTPVAVDGTTAVPDKTIFVQDGG
ncbi:MAG: carboxypeptidase regulatory-like domain-containing protein [Frankiaceae bacterium]|nr:carboxypeptidase regulatory-like domain-containing protein [Frankiaceae bacterium]